MKCEYCQEETEHSKTNRGGYMLCPDCFFDECEGIAEAYATEYELRKAKLDKTKRRIIWGCFVFGVATITGIMYGLY